MEVIYSAFKKINENQIEGMDTMDIHFVYAGEYYYYTSTLGDRRKRLITFIRKGMQAFKIKKVMVTLNRLNLMGIWKFLYFYSGALCIGVTTLDC